MGVVQAHGRALALVWQREFTLSNRASVRVLDFRSSPRQCPLRTRCGCRDEKKPQEIQAWEKSNDLESRDFSLILSATLASVGTTGAQQTADPRVADLVKAGNVRVGLFVPQFIKDTQQAS